MGIPMEMGQILAILMMAVALGMDAFSLGLGLGMKGIRLLNVLRVSAVVGFFHMLMPFLGIAMGKFVSSIIGDIAIFMGGALLVLLGLNMLYNSIRGEAVGTVNDQSIWGLMIFAFSVSLDSFSVGISLGLFAANLVFTIFLFGFFGGFMSVLGLLLGRRFSSWLGVYGEAVGGMILLIFGMKFIF